MICAACYMARSSGDACPNCDGTQTLREVNTGPPRGDS